MEDLRPYRMDDDDPENIDENPGEWELARLSSDDEVPFHVPRD